KSDGYFNYRLTDFEDSMPAYLDPENPEDVPSLDLPLLNNPLSELPLNEEIKQELKSIVLEWDLTTIATFLDESFIYFIDDKAESTLPIRSKQKLVDQGNCKYKLVMDKHTKQRRAAAMEAASTEAARRPMPLLSTAQKEACITRIARLKDFIKRAKDFTILDMVYHVDPHYKYACDVISTDCRDSPNGSLALISRESPFSNAGNISPKKIAEDAKKAKKKS
ncbi:MAG: hypothetical protein EBU93_06765, partial [Chlamydiae bacterium]|nr:hypothetical protein [Chlamydiota bacterium]